MQSTTIPTPALPRPHWIRRVAMVACWAYLVMIIVLVALIYWLADVGWVLTLFIFGPRWMVGLPLLILVPTALVMRSRRAIVLVVVAGLLVVISINQFVINLRGFNAGQERGALRIVTCNLGGRSLQSPAWQRFWEQTRPDLLILQESIPHESVKDFVPADWTVIPGPQNIRILSRYPAREIAHLTHRELGASGGAIRVRIAAAGLEWDILAVHLPTPRPGLESVQHGLHRGIDDLREVIQVRHRAAERCREMLRRDPAATSFVAGDFNCPTDSVIYREHWSDWSNAFGTAGLGLGQTKLLKWYGTRIDHILYQKPWSCRSCWIGPDVGSDHRPVVADFDLAN